VVVEEVEILLVVEVEILLYEPPPPPPPVPAVQFSAAIVLRSPEFPLEPPDANVNLFIIIIDY
jgi:hypothetical protein